MTPQHQVAIQLVYTHHSDVFSEQLFTHMITHVIQHQTQHASDAHLSNHQLRNITINSVIQIISQWLLCLSIVHVEKKHQHTHHSKCYRPCNSLIGYELY